MQTSLWLAPITALYMPTVQVSQSALRPVTVEYAPLPHARHTPALVAPLRAPNVPATHALQASGPDVVLNVPRSHRSHRSPLLPVYPALHWQLAMNLSPAALIELAGQAPSQLATADAPTLVPNVPEGHPLHDAADDDPRKALNVPAIQGLHVVEAIAPSTSLHVPTGQRAHAANPDTVLNEPNVHALQSHAVAPVYPREHTQSISALLATGLVELPGHGVHTDTSLAPTVVLYVPSSHWLHGDVCPATVPYVPAPHATQLDDAVAPTAVDIVPVAQSVQLADPGAALNVPAAHGLHGPPSIPVYPGLHTQSVGSTLPGSEFEFAPQEYAQLATADAPLTMPYNPAGHGAQWSLDDAPMKPL